ncbi:MAG TPA: carbamoyl-phosphate synthase large subunit [Armatimonadota bacterium]|nr:carbamoyl-phosphate synthase large subunit [Armatimonadota bacterium]
MPRRNDIDKVLLIGSGPIIIGQACEFDYSGTQACKALREEGYQVVLVNSNPATIMTDPELADFTYIEPITARTVERIIATERPNALLPTLGGQTGLNVAVELSERGVLARYNVEMIGAKRKAIKKAEDRELFKDAMKAAGLEVPGSGLAYNMRGALQIAEDLGFPLIVRPSSTLGGTGAGIALNEPELREIVAKGLELSPFNEVLIEESVIGWKEYELEVMRDGADNVVIICSIENFDAMGVHTGDSITVAPAQTLTDKEYQRMRDAALRVIREIGVETGGSNIQFAVHPQTGRMVVIEMNPRVSRSSALASKATGFPIAKIAAKLAVGYTLDEIRNDITRETPASFEPTIDYCVVKIPRWAFEKFPGSDPTLTTQMKSVGETMAIGRTFKEALQKGLRSLEIGRFGFGADGRGRDLASLPMDEICEGLRVPNPDRLFYLRAALCRGVSVDEIYRLSAVDPWFISNLREIVQYEDELRRDSRQLHLDLARADGRGNGDAHGAARVRRAKELGFSDVQIGHLLGTDEMAVRRFRKTHGILPTVKLVDTCAAEFEAYTPYYYATYEREDEGRPSDRRKVLILGSGPNRIGQGIEFDYCCCHASFALKEDGFETIMVNSNPETVSTDYDTSDKLYFEPLVLENVLDICDKEQPWGVIVQFGGQTPLNLAQSLAAAGVPIIGTSPESIARAEDRQQFKELIEKLGLNQPQNGTATSAEGACAVAKEIGYPVVVRPSFVLGGRAMEIVYDDASLREYMQRAVEASPQHPVLIDRFLEDAIEIDVDAVSDGERVVIGGIMEHIEEAGIHSGDSACVLPPYSLNEDELETIRDATYRLARELQVVGLLNIQFAIKSDVVYVLEVNPRASRTVPYVSKSIGRPLAKIAARVMAGRSLEEQGFTEEVEIPHTTVKCPVFPFSKFPTVDPVLGPEMRSTGEVMGIDEDFGRAYAKAYIAAGHNLPLRGTAFVSVRNKDKRAIIFLAKRLADLGFEIIATKGTGKVLTRNGVPARIIHRIHEAKPNILDLMAQGRIDLIINTPSGQRPKEDQARIRRDAVRHGVTFVTTISGAMACVSGIEALRSGATHVRTIQQYQQRLLDHAPQGAEESRQAQYAAI